jgi:L-ascorbate metabolism protein UlaG (beta-lactamase superfamily)
MDINWLGYSCFRIRGRNATIVTDPYSPDFGYSLGKPTAGIVTVSHPHPGHSYVEGVVGEPRTVQRPGEYEVKGVLIVAVDSFHDDAKGVKLGRNTIYLMDVDEVSVCHLGDLGHALTPDQAEQLEDVDVLLVPVGGKSTIDAAAAAGIVRQLAPKIVVPMHYRTDAYDGGLESAGAFLKEMGQSDVEPRPKLTVTKSNLPLTTQVVLLEY